MSPSVLICARCAMDNHSATRFCTSCGLPLGSLMPDADAAYDALGPYEAPEPADPDTTRLIRTLVERSGYEAGPAGHGWRMVVPLELDRHQVVFVGHAGTDPDGRSILSLVSVCGPAGDRDTRTLLKLNARVVEGHFAIKVLRGEEYFVVIENLPADSVEGLDSPALVQRIAMIADGLEDRLSRGLDLY
jgi:hypothetical protein